MKLAFIGLSRAGPRLRCPGLPLPGAPPPVRCALLPRLPPAPCCPRPLRRLPALPSSALCLRVSVLRLAPAPVPCVSVSVPRVRVPALLLASRVCVCVPALACRVCFCARAPPSASAFSFLRLPPLAFCCSGPSPACPRPLRLCFVCVFFLALRPAPSLLRFCAPRRRSVRPSLSLSPVPSRPCSFVPLARSKIFFDRCARPARSLSTPRAALAPPAASKKSGIYPLEN